LLKQQFVFSSVHKDMHACGEGTFMERY